MRTAFRVALIATVLSVPAPVMAQDAPLIAERWARLVERHRPGVLDDELREMAAWEDHTFRSVLGDLGALLRLHDGDARRNGLLLAGAMTHADIALLAPAQAARFLSIDPRDRPASVTRGLDGERLGTENMTAHWEFARVLLDRVKPDPAHASFVRSFYQAVAALFLDDLRLAELKPHLERGLDLFPNDSLLSLFAGAMHETFASPLYQRMREDVGYRPPDRGPFRPGVEPDHRKGFGTPAQELSLAEGYLRSAVAAEPGNVEARIRLARVVGGRGRHAEAASVLRAVADTKEPILRFYAALFLGAEEASLGHVDAARESYERAAALYLSAESPLIALSALARSAGDGAAAQGFMRRLAALPADPARRLDPWTEYAWSAGRRHEELLRSVRSLSFSRLATEHQDH